MTFAAGQKIKTTDLGSWTSYTPTLTNLTATATAEYTQIGDLVVYRCRLVMSGAGAAGVAKVSVPLPVHSSYANKFTGCMCHMDDTSAAIEYLTSIKVESGGTDLTFWSISSAGSAATAWWGNTPVAFVSPDTWDFTLMYKPA